MKKLLLSISILISLLSCNPNISSCDEVGEKIPFAKLFDENISTCILLDTNDNSEIVNLIIQTQEDFTKHIECSDNLSLMDFSTRILLVGKINSKTCGHIYNIELLKRCNSIDLIITLEDGICGAETVIPYYLIIKKEDLKKVNYILRNK